MSGRRILLTGGTGFIGSALAQRLVRDGHTVRLLDDDSRGRSARLDPVASAIEFIRGDVRDPLAVDRATLGIDCVIHLAAVNGTQFFYSKPELVLEVGVKGMLNVLESSARQGVGEVHVASSSEAYQSPSIIPTPEDVPLVIPDPLNPRYSYAGSKIISEILALSWGIHRIPRVVIFRPHNVYGPDMGWEHVIPQLAVRLSRAAGRTSGLLTLPIQGTGEETRAFTYIDDLVDGIMLLLECGAHRTIYHIGSEEEVSIEQLAMKIGRALGRDVAVKPGPVRPGGTSRRCPDTSRIRALGFSARISLADGLEPTVRWYDAHARDAPADEEIPR